MFGRRSSMKLRLERNRLQVESLEDRRMMSATAMGAGAAAQPETFAVQTSATLLTTEEWVHTLTYTQFNVLTPEQAVYLTPAQIATIPNAAYFGQMSAASRSVLSATQVRALNTSAPQMLSLLTTAQINALLPAQIQAVPFYELNYVTPQQVPNISAVQLATIPSSGMFEAWAPAARAALTQPQVQALNMSVIRPLTLTGVQINYLTVPQIQSIAFYDLNYLTQWQTPYVSTSQIAAMNSTAAFETWTPEARAALTQTQVRAINTAVVRPTVLTPTQAGWLTASQVQQIPFYDLHLLTAAQIPYLVPAQVELLNEPALNEWSAAARAALTKPQVQWLDVTKMRITQLTPLQRGYLKISQIQSLPYYDLNLMTRWQAPYITAKQLGMLSTTAFNQWDPLTLQALNKGQIQALNMTLVRPAVLTPLQRGYMTAAQLQTLPFYELDLLTKWQVPYLTNSQIAAINAAGVLAAWSPEARAALTPTQVQTLRVADVGISLLTPAQIGWLSNAQLQAVKSYEYIHLHPWQIPLLAASNFAAMTEANVLNALSAASQSMLTREQLMALKPAVWAMYSLSITSPSNYHPSSHMPIGTDGLPTMPSMVQENEAVLALVPVTAATHKTVKSGNWSDPTVWHNGVVPAAGAKVLVAGGHTVRFDANMTAFAINTLRVDGALEFATNVNTQLKVDTVVVTVTGKLHIGTAAAPIQDHVVAKVLIADGGPINQQLDPGQWGRGLISRGEVRMHGKVVTPYVALSADPKMGDTKLYLSQVPTNWKVGDRLVIAGTQQTSANFGAEERTILAIQGAVVTVSPLFYDHYTPAGAGQSVHVSNLERNVVFEAEDASVVAERPHMMFMHNRNVEIANIGVHGFGRTDKSIRIGAPVTVNGVLQTNVFNTRGRYGMHFHHTGVNPAYEAAQVTGSVLTNSGGWGYVNHSSNVDFENNVAYHVNGSSFVTEDGNEIGSMKNNLALSTTGAFQNIASRRDIHDFGIEGHGFWFQGPGIEVVGNISAGSNSGGFAYFTASSKNLFEAVNLDDPALAGGREAVPVDSVPLKRFDGNTAYAGRTGIEIWHHMSKITDGQTYIDNFTAWGNRMSGVEAHYSGRITIRNLKVIGNLAAPTGAGVFTNRFTHDLTLQNAYIVGMDVGLGAPVRGATVVDGGYFAAVTGIYIEKGYDARRTVDIRGPVQFAPLSASQLQGRRQSSVNLTSFVEYAEQSKFSADAYFTSDSILFRPTGSAVYQLYFHNQLNDAVPFPTAATGYVPASYIGQTNAQLRSSIGKSFGGVMITRSDAFERADIIGMVRQVG